MTKKITKYYVFGDTGGHLKTLVAGLKQIGVDTDNYVIPEDMQIIHMGDLIHKGPASLRALVFVENMMLHNPGQWIQLMGNHEMQHLPNTNWFYPCSCSETVDDKIDELITSGLLRTAYALEDVTPVRMEKSARHRMKPASSSWLFTHGGMTADWWFRMHNREASVLKLAEQINNLTDKQKDKAGERMGQHGRMPSPVWASAPTEVFSSWKETPMPFNQVTGHTYPFDWESERWFGSRATVKDYIKSTVLNPDQRIALTKVGENLLMVTDPGFESGEPSISAQPGTLFGTTSE